MWIANNNHSRDLLAGAAAELAAAGLEKEEVMDRMENPLYKATQSIEAVLEGGSGQRSWNHKTNQNQPTIIYPPPKQAGARDELDLAIVYGWVKKLRPLFARLFL